MPGEAAGEQLFLDFGYFHLGLFAHIWAQYVTFLEGLL